MSDIECIFQSVTDKGSIYISNFPAANNLPLLQSLNIKAILSVARSGLLNHSKTDIPYYLYIPADDHKNYELHRHFNQTYEFIEQARKQTNVLVHCMAGISRSVTIVMAYLMKKYKTSLNQVISMVQRKRTKVNPNTGFIQQLKIYAEQEGLKCDFEGNQIPLPKERHYSTTKHKRMGSLDVKVSKKQQYQLYNPLEKVQQKADIYWKILGQTKEDSNQIKKQLHFQEDKSPSNEKNVEKKDEKTQQYQIKNDEKLYGKKQYEYKQTKHARKMSIEERINLIRDKIKKDEIKSPKIKRNNWFDSTRTSGKKGPNMQVIINNLEQVYQSGRKKGFIIDNSTKTPYNDSISRLIEHQKRQSCQHTRQTSPFNSYKLQEDIFKRPTIPKSKKNHPIISQQ